MATFRVHEDKEKENRVLLPAKSHQSNVNLKEKRPTFAVLNNISSNVRDLGEKAIFREKTILNKNIKTNDENARPNKGNVKNEKVEQFKAFSVYEDRKENKEVAVPKDGKREPLHALKSCEFLTTPMSVGELLSPMSVDKSIVIDDIEKAETPRNDRERFFEVEEYQRDILDYLKSAERSHRPKPGYMQKQPDINQSMRTILVDWLVEVCEEYRLQSETLSLAVSYIDRFLSFMSVVRAKLQLVGTAAIFIAAKYEEIYPPDVGEFVYITDDTYTKTQVLRMEQLILKVLSFDLSVPTTLVFTTTYCVMNDVPEKVKFLTMYLCELSLLDADPFLKFLPSKISAAALALARYTLEYPIWSKALEENTGYTLEKDLRDIIQHLSKTHNVAGTLAQQAIQEKYKGNKYMQVSTISPCQLTDDVFEKIQEAIARAPETIQNDSSGNTSDKRTENNESVRQMISLICV